MSKMHRKKVRACIRILEDLYGVPSNQNVDPIDLLVMTILSQNTSDINSIKAFRKLKSAFPNYNDLINSSTEDIAKQIRSGGLAEIKALRIKRALCRIEEDIGSIDLGFLAYLTKEVAENYLISLPGVGPKTASVVLLFAFNKHTMPVDTHVYRVSRRLGLVPIEASIEKTKHILEEITPPEKYLSLHLNLIKHGRLICKARGPKHEECKLRPLCDYYSQAQALNDNKNHPQFALR